MKSQLALLFSLMTSVLVASPVFAGQPQVPQPVPQPVPVAPAPVPQQQQQQQMPMVPITSSTSNQSTSTNQGVSAPYGSNTMIMQGSQVNGSPQVVFGDTQCVYSVPQVVVGINYGGVSSGSGNNSDQGSSMSSFGANVMYQMPLNGDASRICRERGKIQSAASISQLEGREVQTCIAIFNAAKTGGVSFDPSKVAMCQKYGFNFVVQQAQPVLPQLTLPQVQPQVVPSTLTPQLPPTAPAKGLY